jgi:hypothetical protein
MSSINLRKLFRNTVDLVRLARICHRWNYICGVSSASEVLIIEPGKEFPFKEHILCRYDELFEMSEPEVTMFIVGVIFK